MNGAKNPRAWQQLAVAEDLSPSAKVVWLVLASDDSGSMRRIPPLRLLQRQANVGSASAVSKALASLRITRWLTINNANQHGDVRIYLLHSAPLDPRMTLRLDTNFVAYLRSAQRHADTRLRVMASKVLREIRTDLSWTDDESEYLSAGHDPGPNASAWLSAGDWTMTSAQLEMAITDTHTDVGDDRKPGSGEGAELVFPPRWTPDQVDLAKRYLKDVALMAHQALLDEVAGRAEAIRQGAPPLYDELRYLKRLCDAARADAFHPNLGGAIRQRRERASRSRRVRSPLATSGKHEPHNDELAAQAFAEIRRTLGRRKSG